MKSEVDLKTELKKIEENYELHRREGIYNHGAIGEHIGPWQYGQIACLRYVLEMPVYELPYDIVLQEDIQYAEMTKEMDERIEECKKKYGSIGSIQKMEYEARKDRHYRIIRGSFKEVEDRARDKKEV